VKLPITT